MSANDHDPSVCGDASTSDALNDGLRELPGKREMVME